MDRLVRRKSIIFKLSIIALVLYVLLTLISMLSQHFIEDFENLHSFRSIISNIMIPVMLIGYVAVYVLWTPDSEGNIRNRPTWQFVLLLVAYIVPKIMTFMIDKMINNDFESGAMLNSVTLHTLNTIIKYTFLTIRCTILILLMNKCERKAKKIFAVSIISAFVWLAGTLGRTLINSIEDYSLFNRLNEYHVYIWSLAAITLSTLYYIFTVIYTRQKYKEVEPEEEVYVGGPLKKESLDSPNPVDSWK